VYPNILTICTIHAGQQNTYVLPRIICRYTHPTISRMRVHKLTISFMYARLRDNVLGLAQTASSGGVRRQTICRCTHNTPHACLYTHNIHHTCRGLHNTVGLMQTICRYSHNLLQTICRYTHNLLQTICRYTHNLLQTCSHTHSRHICRAT